MEETETIINGVVEGIIYRNPENGYSVLDVSYEGKLITAVGLLSVVEAGEQLVLRGTWVNHPTFGSQFKVESFERRIPKNAADMLRYLSGGTIKGIGPATAQKIVERFGDKTFEIMENQPGRLAEIRGISMQKAEKIAKEYRRQLGLKKLVLLLSGSGIAPEYAVRMYRGCFRTRCHRDRQ